MGRPCPYDPGPISSLVEAGATISKMRYLSASFAFRLSIAAGARGRHLCITVEYLRSPRLTAVLMERCSCSEEYMTSAPSVVARCQSVLRILDFHVCRLRVSAPISAPALSVRPRGVYCPGPGTQILSTPISFRFVCLRMRMDMLPNAGWCRLSHTAPRGSRARCFPLTQWAFAGYPVCLRLPHSHSPLPSFLCFVDGWFWWMGLRVS